VQKAGPLVLDLESVLGGPYPHLGVVTTPHGSKIPKVDRVMVLQSGPGANRLMRPESAGLCWSILLLINNDLFLA
jgi:hypothetical protein